MAQQQWPSTLAEYQQYESDVVGALGVAPSAFLPDGAVSQRFSDFRGEYANDEGDCKGGPANTSAARVTLLRVLAKAHEHFLPYYKKVKASLCESISKEQEKQAGGTCTTAPAAPPTTTTVNTVLGEMQLASCCTAEEIKLMQSTCSAFLHSACNVSVVCTPNAVEALVSKTCEDYVFDLDLVDDVRAALSRQAVRVLCARGPPPTGVVTTATTAAPAPAPATQQVPGTKRNRWAALLDEDEDDNSDGNDDSNRIYLGEVLDDILDELGDDDMDLDLQQDIKMKAGMLMARDDKKKRHKRKRDDMGRRVYTPEDRPAIEKHIRTALRKKAKTRC